VIELLQLRRVAWLCRERLGHIIGHCSVGVSSSGWDLDETCYNFREPKRYFVTLGT
jgi:hypothetical protein